LHGLGNKVVAKGVARQVARRPALQGWMRQPAFEQGVEATALDRMLAPGIESLAAASDAADEPVEQQVAGSRLEPDHIPQPTAGRQKHNAGQSTEMEKQARFVGILEKDKIDHRRERKAVAADDHVTATKFTDDSQAGSLGH